MRESQREPDPLQREPDPLQREPDPMIAEILATGDEIRSGALVDTNSAHIALRLEEYGAAVTRHACVGDDMDRLAEIIGEIAGRADLCVVTGGLGPTTDDLSAAAAARAAGADLVLDERALADIQAFFDRRDRPMGPSNRKQAMMPAGARPLYNPVGTAPGFDLLLGRCRFFFLPGVPHEMRRMLDDAVLPAVTRMAGTDRDFIRVRSLSTFGLPESTVGERVALVPERFEGVKLGLRARFPVIQVKLYACGRDAAAIDSRLEEAAAWVRQTLGNRVFSEGEAQMPAVVGELLRKAGATVAAAESCTGGLIANWLTDVPGSSDYFLFSGVTYSNEAKVRVLGVSADTLAECGAVHERTAAEMAEGARRLAGATYAVATTGIAGPAGGTVEKPVGTVCIGLAGPEGTEAHRFQMAFPTRSANKIVFAMTALDRLRLRLLLGARPKGDL